MRKDELSALCQRAVAGEEARVENLDLRYGAQVVACHEHYLTVEAFGHRFDWAADHCRAVSGRDDPLGPPSNL